MPAKPKPDRQSPNARDTLIEAAIDEFSRNGYAATTLADIARRAGVTTGAVYAHFDGKLDLLLEALGLRTADHFIDVAVDAGKVPAAQFTQALAQGLVSASFGRRALILLDVIAFARRDPEAAKALKRMVAVRHEAFERMTRAGVDSGFIDPTLPYDELARLVSGLAFGMLVQRALGEPTAHTHTVAELAEHLLHPAPERGRGADAHLARVKARAVSAQRAQTALRHAVATAAAAGASLRKLGQAAGLSHERIRVMLAEQAAPRASRPSHSTR
ncbi:MAG TPA: TetR family transcriptional regulator [Pseudomonadales bacterium]|nr:TetR family transcriptional regulator [Pseudomonadales bacterium]